MPLFYHYFFLLVLKPNGKYKGQKLIRLVSMNTAAKIKATIATVPVNTLVNASVNIKTATSILITLSILPIFFFII